MNIFSATFPTITSDSQVNYSVPHSFLYFLTVRDRVKLGSADLVCVNHLNSFCFTSTEHDIRRKIRSVKCRSDSYAAP
jgi:hypothetical protein